MLNNTPIDLLNTKCKAYKRDNFAVIEVPRHAQDYVKHIEQLVSDKTKVTLDDRYKDHVYIKVTY